MATKKKGSSRKATAKRAIMAKKKGGKSSPKRKSAPKKKTTTKRKGKKPAFGGYAVNFGGRQETVEQVFGKKPIPPSEMTKKIWAFVKTKKLSNR